MSQLSQEQKRDVSISKSLSYLLRHGAEKEKLHIDDYGYVSVNQLLAHQRLKSFRTTLEDIERIVENNDKKRFTLADRDGGLKICANQGHSIKAVGDKNLVLLSKETMPKEVFHGTYSHKLSKILESGGLSRMNRNHIHFASEISNLSGIRKGSEILIYIDTEKCLENGLKFYKSSNKVILSAGNSKGMIPRDCFKKIVDAKSKEEIEVSKFLKI